MAVFMELSSFKNFLILKPFPKLSQGDHYVQKNIEIFIFSDEHHS